MKKHLSLVLTALVMLSMAVTGCAAPAPIPTLGPVTIRFAYQEGIADYTALAEDFHQLHPTIQVELLPVDAYQNEEALPTEMLTADVVRLNSFLSPQDIISGSLPLDTLIEGDPFFPNLDYFAGALEALRVKEQQIGVPAGLNPFIFAYDIDLFTQAGVSQISFDWTLEDLVENATRIDTWEADADMDSVSAPTFGYCTSSGSIDPFVITYLLGGALFDNFQHPTRPTLDSNENVAAMTWYASLFNDYGIASPIDPLGNPAERSSEPGVSCGFWLRLFYDFLEALPEAEQTPAHAVGLLPLPQVNRALQSSPLVIQDSYHLMKTSLYPREAWLWISYLSQQESASGKLIPPVKSHIASAAYAERVSPTELAIAQRLNSPLAAVGYEMMGQEAVNVTITLYLQVVTRIVSQQVNPLTVLSAAQIDAVEAFAEQNER